MNVLPAMIVFAAVGCVGWIEACTSGSSDGSAKPVASALDSTGAPTAAAAAATTKPSAAPAKDVAPCGPKFSEPAFMQRAGRAHLVFNGGGLSIDAVGAPAICGPLYNTNVSVLAVHAGDGLQFEACVAEGIVRISSVGRTPGTQQVNTGQQASGVEVTFEALDGETYSARGTPTDSVVFAPDLWKVDADLVLHAVEGEGRLTVRVSIDCAAQGP